MGLTALALYLVAPLSTRANLLGKQTRKVTVTLTQGTNVVAAPAPDGGTIVLGLHGALWRLAGGGGKAKPLTGWEVEATWPAWSPDGTRIAFQYYSDNYYHIWTMGADGKKRVQVTSGPFDHREPAWSPDGTRIAFSSDRSGNGSYDVWTIELATGTYEQRTSGSTNEHSPAWSPDGAWIAYADGRRVLAVNAAGQTRELASVPAGSVQAPSWAPDGERVAYLSNTRQIVIGGQVVTSPSEDVFPFPVRWLPDGRFLYTADGKVRVRDGDGTAPADVPFSATLELQRPVREPQDHGFDSRDPRPVLGLLAPALSPDGKKIAFVALNDVWVMTIGKPPVRLTSDAFLDWDPTWSRDGRFIHFASDRHGDGSPDIYAIEVATGALTRVSSIAGTDVVTPVASPDGQRFAYISTDQALMVYDVATGQSRKLVDQAEGSTVGRPSWSPDGTTIALTDLRQVSSRFREGYNLIRTVDVATGAATFHEVAPAPDGIADRVEAGPVWSPDGRWMAFIMRATLHVVPVSPRGVPTGPAVQLTDHAADMTTGAPRCFCSCWPNGRKMASVSPPAAQGTMSFTGRSG
jgi:Tol biopolymer transport system component